ncbi:MAG: YbaB/EbfC family nucleoid-associated protein [Alphaproteobacteria bacterium]
MNLQKMMKQAQDMQRKITELQATLEAQEVDGTAGGGVVKVRVNGKHRPLSVSIDASLMKADEKDMLEDLIIAALHDAHDKIDASFADEMGKATSGMNLPPGMKLPF